MKLLVFVFLLFVLTFNSFPQKQGLELIDSLKKVLPLLGEDTSKVRTLGKISFQYFQFETDSGIYYGKRALDLAEKLSWGAGIAFSYNYIGTNNAVKGNYPLALDFFFKSLAKYTEIGDKIGIAMLCNNLGNFYRLQKNFPKAIEYLTKSEMINLELKNIKDLKNNYNNLGSVYSFLADYEKSNHYYFKTLELARQGNDEHLISLSLLNIADNRLKLKDYCGALEFNRQALDLLERLKIQYELAVGNQLMGQIYLGVASNDTLANKNCNLFSQNKYDILEKAKGYLLESLELMKGVDDLSVQSETYSYLSIVYEKLGDTKNALFYFKEYSTAKDSIFSQDNSLKMAELEKIRELELKDQHIKIQELEIEKKTTQLYNQIILSLLIVLIGALIVYYFHKKRQREKRISAEIEKARADKALFENAEKAEESNRLKSSILANMSHEIRTPMIGIMGYAEMIEETTNDEQLREYAVRIKNSSNRLMDTLTLLLDISELEAGKKDIKRSDVDILKIIEEVCEHFKELAKNRSLFLEIVSAEKLPELHTNETMLRQIISNLVNNAVKFTVKGGVVISLSKLEVKGNDYAVIEVKDTGIGIASENLEFIWDDFRQVSEGHGRNFEGTGLGLSLSKKFTEKLNGKIEIVSVFGEGSSFIVRLPFNNG